MEDAFAIQITAMSLFATKIFTVLTRKFANTMFASAFSARSTINAGTVLGGGDALTTPATSALSAEVNAGLLAIATPQSQKRVIQRQGHAFRFNVGTTPSALITKNATTTIAAK